MLESPAPSPSPPLIGIRGWLIDAPEFGKLRSWPDGAIVLEGPLIAEVGDYMTLSKKPRTQPVRWLHSSRVVVFPGLIDLHTHVPQYPAVARGTSELLPWLRQYVFPLEKDFTGPRGRREAAAFIAELARHGTTTAMLYSAVFEDSCEATFQAAADKGLRAIIGKMMMDVASYGPHQPSKILSISVAETERLIRRWHGANDGLLEYAVSPRFAVSCSEKLMQTAAEIAQRHGTYVQTHLAENREELEKVRHLFPQAQDYTDVYARSGLLGPRTVLGHCLHLSPREHEAIAASGAAIAHCPGANLFLRSGILPLDTVRAAGIRVGLGTDVAAGPELNLWRVMRAAIDSQTARSFYEPGVATLTPAGALHLATQGAADVLGKGRAIGSFDIGKEADLTIMDPGSLLPYRTKGASDLGADDVVSLCVYRGGPDSVIETFVRGRSVHRALEPELF
ncbi:MAG: guanine deaminase [Chthoniobacteraceae bacterium]